mgnify:CR=1 FL=1
MRRRHVLFTSLIALLIWQIIALLIQQTEVPALPIAFHQRYFVAGGIDIHHLERWLKARAAA